MQYLTRNRVTALQKGGELLGSQPPIGVPNHPFSKFIAIMIIKYFKLLSQYFFIFFCNKIGKIIYQKLDLKQSEPLCMLGGFWVHF